jgi:predicted GIY-YIG superfamily endonuclease
MAGRDTCRPSRRAPALKSFVYILRCADNTFYVGHTDDLDSRTALHNAGFGATYTAVRRPVILVHSEEFATQASAIARERQLKRWSAKKKSALIAGDPSTLKLLSRRRR